MSGSSAQPFATPSAVTESRNPKGDTLRNVFNAATAASMLMHAAFAHRDKNTKVLSAVEETCGQIQEFVSHHRPEKALELLSMVKKTLERLTGVRAATRQSGLRQSLPLAA